MRFIPLFFFFVTSYVTGQTSLDLPNIVLIIADDIGWNDVGCYGNEVVKTPNMDRIAREGMRFDNAYLTTSSCSPSRTSIISGRYPHNTGAAELHTPLPPEVGIFPEKLQEAGYFTGQAGKWHMGNAPRRGFDVIYDGRDDLGPGGEKMWVPLLQNRPKDQPFFLWLAATDAHRGWGPNMFEGQHHPEDVQVPPFLVDSLGTRMDLAKYYDEIMRFDYYIGEVERELKVQGVADQTLIMIISDNGRPFPRCKTRLYDSGVKTPLIVKWPHGMNGKGQTSGSLVSVIDIGATLLEVAGAPPLKSMQGQSFLKLFNAPNMPFRNYIFSEHNWHDHEALERMVRTRDYLYILNLRPNLPNQGPADSNNSPSFVELKDKRTKHQLTAAQVDVFLSPRPREELFDCQRDPLQLINIVADPAMDTKLSELRKIMMLWMEQTGDTHPEQLTPDWYSRESGAALDIDRKRGEMPGASQSAVSVSDPGPF
ncbi:sulfatase [Membranicola marinus]|uniref:Sulfatase n=1 Tax=Membranihabitans marinus TaxID=1227546 RepID=A0A953HY01_9BACT|nr:sulfatase [Membranihabitans marinus]MBY5958726.1 sulfatase [Membranihabitans marinus]